MEGFKWDIIKSIINEDFKADAIHLLKKSGRTIPSVAKDLGGNHQTLRNWLKKDSNRQNPDKVKIMKLAAELRSEKRRVMELEESVAILKKATAIFATSNRD
ncbi:MAG: transposase [Clostridia bacterium]|nr:transposase [Clostridia bacterium]